MHDGELKFQPSFFPLTLLLTRSTPSIGMTGPGDDAIDIGEDMGPKKRKTTYNWEHPTENPKSPKCSKAEIQEEAAEKRATSLAKKKERESLQAAAEIKKQEKRWTSLKEVVAMEDTIQRKQRQYQLQAECPDLQTMEDYWKIQETQASRAVMVVYASTTGEIEQDSDVEVPPWSIIDTDSDGGLLGAENISFDGDEGEHDTYLPAVDKDNLDEDEEEYISSDASVEQGNTKKPEKGAKVQKVR